MNINCGRFDRKIEIIELEKVNVSNFSDVDFPFLKQNNSSNKEIKIYSVYAEVKELRGKEKIENNLIVEEKLIKIVTRFLRDVTNEMLVKYNDKYYEITSISELGRREYTEIMAVEKVYN